MKLAHASPYIEAGTGVGTASAPDALAGQAVGATGLGFVGSFNLYFPVTSQKNPIHLDLGIQNRLTMVNGTTSSPMLITPNIAARLEFWRFYVGFGYSPYVLVDMKPRTGATSYFGEAGIIWRVVPEFQICGTIALEYGKPNGGGSSPSPSSEYGLRFRFPLSPNEHSSAASGSGSDFDGYRYPFGIMK